MFKLSSKMLGTFIFAFMMLVPAARAQVEIVFLDAGDGYDRTIEDFILANTEVPVNFNFTSHPAVTTDTLNAADLIIIGRSHSSFAFANDESRTKFAAVTTPIISFNPFAVRPSRLGWVDTEDIDFEVQFTTAEIVNPSSELVAGLGEAGTLQVFEDGPYDPPLYRSGAEIDHHRLSATNNDMDNTNGDVILRDVNNANHPILVAWEQGVEFYTGGPVAGGPRTLAILLDDRNYSDIGDTTVSNVQLDTLSPDGAEMLRKVLNNYVAGLPVALDSFVIE